MFLDIINLIYYTSKDTDTIFVNCFNEKFGYETEFLDACFYIFVNLTTTKKAFISTIK